MKTFSNHSGTMRDRYGVGKNGIEIIHGEILPDETIEAPLGSLYLFKGKEGRAYLMTERGWEALLTKLDIDAQISDDVREGVREGVRDATRMLMHEFSDDVEKNFILHFFWNLIKLRFLSRKIDN